MIAPFDGMKIVGTIPPGEAAAIRLDAEREGWTMVKIADFLERENVVVCLRRRLGDYYLAAADA